MLIRFCGQRSRSQQVMTRRLGYDHISTRRPKIFGKRSRLLLCLHDLHWVQHHNLLFSTYFTSKTVTVIYPSRWSKIKSDCTNRKPMATFKKSPLLSDWNWIWFRKTEKSVFEPPFGRLRGNIRTPSISRKARAIEFYRYLLWLRRYQRKSVEVGVRERQYDNGSWQAPPWVVL